MYYHCCKIRHIFESKGYLMNKLIPLLLHNYKNNLITTPHSYVSIKYDGWRMLWYPNSKLHRGGVFMTRQGTIFEAPEELYTSCVKLSPDNVLDGEMWKGYGYQSSDISSIEGNDKLQYMIFDCPSYPGSYKERYTYLQSLCKSEYKKLHMVEQQLVSSNDLLFHELMNAEVRRGGEGIVIRNPNSMYEFGQRSLNVLKLKPFDIITSKVIGHHDCDNISSYTKSLICTTTESEDGNLVEFRVTYKNVNPPEIGAEIRVRHSQYTTKGLPKFPVYLGVLGGQLKQHLLPTGTHSIQPSIQPEIHPEVLSIEKSQSEVPKLKLKKFKVHEELIIKKEEIPISQAKFQPKILTSFVSGIQSNNLGEYTELTVNEIKGKMRPLNWLTLCSKSGGKYKITMSKSGQIYCDCPAWKYQSLAPKYRSCKHCIMLS